MLGKNGNVGGAGNRAVTIIGAGARVDGNLTFKGFLRVQGEVQGDVTCDGDADGTIVVHSSGNVTGTIKAPRLVVSGRVRGPVYSSESIEIHQGASVVGDAIYKQIDVHAGGVIDGLLTPTPPIAASQSRHEPHIGVAQPDAPAVKELGVARTAVDVAAAPARGWRKIAAAVALIVVGFVAAVLWVRRDASVIATPAARSLVREEPVARVAVPAPPPAAVSEAKEQAKEPPKEPAREPPKAQVKDLPKAPAGVAAVAAAGKDSAKPALPTLPAVNPEADPAKVVEISGVNPDKPADVFFVNTKEPAVLMRKQRDDAGEGKRIDVARGAKRRIEIADGEVFRVAEGRNIEVFFQGRKVTPRTVQSGAWMSFVPQSPGADSESN